MGKVFRFKQFSVDQSGCAMKINTDGVLLGALAMSNAPEAILDIGTGTGVIALMLAQRFPLAQIDAVDIEPEAAKAAAANFLNSPFADRISAHNQDIDEYYQEHTDKKYDLIVSNPPFFINSLKNPDSRKQLARHTDYSFFETLVAGSAAHLTAEGTFALILPTDMQEDMIRLGQEQGLSVKNLTSIKSFEHSEAHRCLISFVHSPSETTSTDFIIYSALKEYSDQYEQLLKPFFTIFN